MDYATSIEEVLWGVTLVAVTVAIHGCGMLATLFATQVLAEEVDRPPSFLRGGSVLVLAAWMIVLVHLAELLVWAGFFVWQGAMPDPSVSYYFSLMQYTTVGSSVSLPSRWRLLEGMLPISGLMTFAWSTGVLLALAEKFQVTQLAAIQALRRARRSGHDSSKRR